MLTFISAGSINIADIGHLCPRVGHFFPVLGTNPKKWIKAIQLLSADPFSL